MSDQENTETTEAKGGKSSLLVTIGVAVVAVLAGVATPFLVTQFSSGATSASKKKQDKAATDAFEFVSFDEVVVNIDEPRLTRYLRLKISLQVYESDKLDVEKLVTKKKLILRDWLTSFLGDQGMESIRGASGHNRLRREIKDHFNSVLAPDGNELILGILFEEFNVQ